MGKNKLKKFAEIKNFSHVIQPTREEIIDGFKYKGKWNILFENNYPIILELGCGKGEYSLGLAKYFPNKNFIGIDIKGARIWKGAKEIFDKNLKNIKFLRTQIELINYLFDKDEISEIWITFPDPQIKSRRSKHRLTHPDFLKKYQKILKKNGSIHLKTDSEFLYGYTNGLLQGLNYKIISSHHDIYSSLEYDLPIYVREIKTFYEQKFIQINKPITYTEFRLT